MTDELNDHIQELVDYTITNEWNYVHEEIGANGMEPGQTVLWSALMINHLMNGYPHPADRFMEEFKGLKVERDGTALNAEEVL